MSISGNLRTMDLAELFQWLSHSGKSGTLVINSPQVEKRIFFRRGAVISTASSDPKEYLGHFLVSHGFIDEVVLARAMEMQSENRMLLGKILVTIAAITEEDLDRMLRLKAEESVYELFTWSEAEFRFLDDELPEFTMHPLSLNITGLVLEGVKRLDDWKQIRKIVPSDQAVPVSTTELVVPDDDPGARQILALVDDDRTIEEIALHSHSSEYQVCRVLYAQILGKRLKVVRPRSVSVAATPASGAAPAVVGPEALVKLAREYLENSEFELALRHLRAAINLEPDKKSLDREMKKFEQSIGKRVEAAGVTLDAVPHLEREFEEFTNLDISPQEGFILTRINGSYDLRTILKISPMPQLDALLVFWRLKEAGHITFGDFKVSGQT